MLAFFVISTHLGGAEKSLLELAIELKRQGKKILVVTPKDHGPLLDRLEQNNIAWKCLPLPPWLLAVSRKKPLHFLISTPFFVLNYLKLQRQLKNFIQQNTITTIHSTGLKYHLFLGFYSLKHSQIKLIIHLRDIVGQSILKKLFLKISKNKNVVWISNSQVTAQSIAPIKTQIIYNGFIPPNNSHTFQSIKSELNLIDPQPLIGIVGALARWKGQREFIEMAAHLTKQGKKYQYVIVGDEIYDTMGEKGEYHYLQTMVKNLNLSKRVHFIGFRENIWDVYSSLDVLVHASILPEPFGRVVVEALLSGCPVTASSAGGPVEIINSSNVGYLHTPGDVHAMADNVTQILETQGLKAKLAKAGKARAQDFSMTEHVRKMTSIFNEAERLS